MPSYVKITRADLEVDITKEYGAGKRERKQVKYNDDLTDNQWLNQMLDEPEEEKKSQHSSHSSRSSKRQKMGESTEKNIISLNIPETGPKSEKSSSTGRRREQKAEDGLN